MKHLQYLGLGQVNDGFTEIHCSEGCDPMSNTTLELSHAQRHLNLHQKPAWLFIKMRNVITNRIDEVNLKELIYR